MFPDNVTAVGLLFQSAPVKLAEYREEPTPFRVSPLDMLNPLTSRRPPLLAVKSATVPEAVAFWERVTCVPLSTLTM